MRKSMEGDKRGWRANVVTVALPQLNPVPLRLGAVWLEEPVEGQHDLPNQRSIAALAGLQRLLELLLISRHQFQKGDPILVLEEESPLDRPVRAERVVWPVLVLMCCEETCGACCSSASLGTTRRGLST
jgi:hypothetical protein